MEYRHSLTTIRPQADLAISSERYLVTTGNCHAIKLTNDFCFPTFAVLRNGATYRRLHRRRSQKLSPASLG
jgi:hypothetical protein